jgi:hypothetical protein
MAGPDGRAKLEAVLNKLAQEALLVR